MTRSSAHGNSGGLRPDGPTKADAAAQLLSDASHPEATPLPQLPRHLQPTDRAEAYAIQSRVCEMTGQPVAGWKIAATSAAGQQHLGVDTPLAGRIPLDRVHPPGRAVDLSRSRLRIAEIEFAFVLGRDITPADHFADRDHVLDAVAELRFGVEFPGTRFSDVTRVGALQLIADNACTQDLVLGDVVEEAWRDHNLAECSMVGEVAGDAGRRSFQGRGNQVLGDPVDAFRWLLQELRDGGYTAYEGQFVSTGSCCPPFAVYPGDWIEARFESLGSISAQVLGE